MFPQISYIVRHGETEWNRDGREQGHLDSPLTERGKAQAQVCGQILHREIANPRALQIYCSPLGRTRETQAVICAELGVSTDDVIFETAIIECSWGAWEGMRWDEIEAANPGQRALREATKWSFVPPDGESYEMVAARVGAWLDGLSGTKNMIVISHGGTGRILRGLLSDMSPDEMLRQETPQDAVFKISSGRPIKLVADIA